MSYRKYLSENNKRGQLPKELIYVCCYKVERENIGAHELKLFGAVFFSQIESCEVLESKIAIRKRNYFFSNFFFPLNMCEKQCQHD